MQLDESTWIEVERYLERSKSILVPFGSTEQHGPIGLIGTDAIVVSEIAKRAGGDRDILVAPTQAFTPAPFNESFPGTISISEDLLSRVVGDIIRCLAGQGFRGFYLLNGHGANIRPLQAAIQNFSDCHFLIRNWWDFESVNDLRQSLYGNWEGMHATPSEVAITQSFARIPPMVDMALKPPQRLTSEYVKNHSGDRHGPPERHRKDFPDGRVGSHSALANPEDGTRFLELVVREVAEEFWRFSNQGLSKGRL